MKKVIVLDTNFLVSAVITPGGVCGNLLIQLLSSDKFRVIAAASILWELRNTLIKSQFNKYGGLDFYHDYLGHLVDTLPIIDPVRFAQQTLPAEIKESTHPKDLHVIQAFLAAGADYLITGNTKDFPKLEGIVTPNEFMKIV